MPRDAFESPPDPGAPWATGSAAQRRKPNQYDPEPARRFIPVRFGDIKLGTDRAYLVKGLIPREGLIVVWGPPKCGKSFFVYDLTAHVALGWEYRGRRVQQGAVVYIACEGERGLGARTEAFRQRFLSHDANPPFWLLTTRLDLVKDVDELIADIRAALGDECPVCIVIDTLNRTLAGSESRDEDMSAYVKAADAVREAFKAAVLVVHHCGINGERPRGHTSLTGAVDAQLAVQRDASDRVLVEVEYMKDGPEGDIIASTLAVVELGEDEDGEPITSLVVEPDDDAQQSSKPAGKVARAKRLPAAQQCALNMLEKAIGKDGAPAEASNHIPAGVSCVNEDLWRRYCAEGGISRSDDPDAKRMAFKRAAEALIAAERVGKWGESVWLPPIR